jgi:hypothetical protein
MDGALTAYADAVALLDLVAWSGLERIDQERLLTEFTAVACAAAACAVACDAPHRAVEVLDQGRGVLFAQQLNARADAPALRAQAPELASRLAAVRRLLESADPPEYPPTLSPTKTTTTTTWNRLPV